MTEDDIYDSLRDALREFDVDPSRVVPTAHLEEDLGLDSLDRLGAMLALEDRFGLSLSGIDEAVTIDDAVKMVISRLPQSVQEASDGETLNPGIESSKN
jgi:acyl carrier protein